MAYQYMNYDQAKKQSGEQVNSLYDNSVKQVQQQGHTNRLAAGNVAANRGLSRSGLAADQLNKVNLATQRTIGDLEAERAAKIASLAQQVMDRDYQKGRDFTNDQRWQTQFDYQKSRDTIGDQRWQTQWDYQKGRDTVADQRYADQFQYQKYRDTVGDTRWQGEIDYRAAQDNRAAQQWQDQFNYQKALQEWQQKYQGQRDAVTDKQWQDQFDQQKRWQQWQATTNWVPYDKPLT